jgi:hypothetical protein
LVLYVLLFGAVSKERYQWGVSEERYQLDHGINWTPTSIERYQKSGIKRAVPKERYQLSPNQKMCSELYFVASQVNKQVVLTKV